MIENISFEIVVQPEPKRYLSNLAFDNRFTDLERAKIDLASSDDITASEDVRLQLAKVRVFLKRAEKAAYVDTSREDTRSALMQLEAFGLLAEGRALEILDLPIADHERYLGPTE